MASLIKNIKSKGSRSFKDFREWLGQHKNNTDAPEGIPNIGNTCYINAVLQVLKWTPGFQSRLDTICTCTTGDSKQHFAACNLRDAIHCTDKRNMRSKLRSLGSSIDKNSLASGTPEDCFELYNAILESLQSGNDNCPAKLFEGTFLITFAYESCGHIERQLQSFTSVSLPIIDNVVCTTQCIGDSEDKLMADDLNGRATSLETISVESEATLDNITKMSTEQPPILQNETKKTSFSYSNVEEYTESKLHDEIMVSGKKSDGNSKEESKMKPLDSNAGDPQYFIMEPTATNSDEEEETINQLPEYREGSKMEQLICGDQLQAIQGQQETDIVGKGMIGELMNRGNQTSEQTADDDITDGHTDEPNNINSIAQLDENVNIVGISSILSQEQKEVEQRKRKEECLEKAEKYEDAIDENREDTEEVVEVKKVEDGKEEKENDKEEYEHDTQTDKQKTYDETEKEKIGEKDTEGEKTLHEFLECLRTPMVQKSETNDGSISIEKSFARFIADECYPEQTLSCRSCSQLSGLAGNNNSKSTKRILIADPPPILVLQLNRVRQVVRNGVVKLEKITNLVSYPGTLDISPYSSKLCAGKINVHYQLYAVIVHLGKLGRGHYISYIKVPAEGSPQSKPDSAYKRDFEGLLTKYENDRELQTSYIKLCKNASSDFVYGASKSSTAFKWFKFNDRKVTECARPPHGDDSLSNAYILFYHEVE